MPKTNSVQTAPEPSNRSTCGGFKFGRLLLPADIPKDSKPGRVSRVTLLPQWKEIMQFIESNPGPKQPCYVTKLTLNQLAELNMKHGQKMLIRRLLEALPKKNLNMRVWKNKEYIIVGHKDAMPGWVAKRYTAWHGPAAKG